MPNPTTDYSQRFKVGTVTFRPADKGSTCQVKPSGYFHSAPCGKPGVTIPGDSAGFRYANRVCCKQHAGVAKRVATNDENRRQEYEARRQSSIRAEQRKNDALDRIKAHGVIVPENTWGRPSWIEVADLIDQAVAVAKGA